MAETRVSTRNYMTKDNVKQIITEWDTKSASDFAECFGVSTNTISVWVKKIREMDETLCQKKIGRQGKREDIISKALEEIKEATN